MLCKNFLEQHHRPYNHHSVISFFGSCERFQVNEGVKSITAPGMLLPSKDEFGFKCCFGFVLQVFLLSFSFYIKPSVLN